MRASLSILTTTVTLGASLLAVLAGDAQARGRQTVDYNPEDARQCMMHIPRNERKQGIPLYLLEAIATNESGRVMPGRRSAVPWPWAVNTGGRGYLFNSRKEAVDFVYSVLEKGNPYIDVGCMQVNIRYHHQAFRTVEDALDPAQNVAYGAKFLRQNYDRTKSWKTAAMHYHSQSPGRGGVYVSGIISRWKRLIATDGNRDLLENMPVFAENGPSRSHPWQLTMPSYLMPQFGQFGQIQPAVAEEGQAAAMQAAQAQRPGKWQRVMQRNVRDIMIAEPETVVAEAVPAVAANLPADAPPAPAAGEAQAAAPAAEAPAVATLTTPEQAAADARREAMLDRIDQQTQVIELTAEQIAQAKNGRIAATPTFASAQAVPVTAPASGVLIDGQNREASGKEGLVSHFQPVKRAESTSAEREDEPAVRMIFPH